MYSFKKLLKMINRENLIGAKADSLITLREYGFKVPDGWVVTPKECAEFFEYNKIEVPDYPDPKTEPDLIAEEILRGKYPPEYEEALRQEIGEKVSEKGVYIIRLSSINPDLFGVSGGQAELITVKSAEEIVAALKRCWAAVYNKRVCNHCKQNKIPVQEFTQTAVIIQHFVKPRCTGTAFSVDAENFDDRKIVLEAEKYAVKGAENGGEKSKPSRDKYTYNWYAEEHGESKIAGNFAVLGDEEVKGLAMLTLDVQTAYGAPMRFEWALAETVYILRCEPIAKINYASVKHDWTAALLRGGSSSVCKPLDASVFGEGFQLAAEEALSAAKLMKKGENTPLYSVFFSRPYWNLSAVKAMLETFPGYSEIEFDRNIGAGMNYKGDGVFNKGGSSGAAKKFLKKRLTSFETETRVLLETLGKLESAKCEGEEILRWWTDVSESGVFPTQTAVFSHFLGNLLAWFLHKPKLESFLADNDGEVREGEFLRLISGLDGIPAAEAAAEMLGISVKIKNGGAVRNEVADFVGKYAHFSLNEYDISAPNFEERSVVINESVKHFARFNIKMPDSTAKNAYLETLEKIPEKLRKNVEMMRELFGQTLKLHDVYMRFLAVLRKATEKLGDFYFRNGILNAAEDIYYLGVGDIRGGETDGFSTIISRNKLYCGSFRSYENPAEFGSGFPAPSSRPSAKKTIKGVTCGAGSYTGTARVIKDINGADRLGDGDILVTGQVGAAWSGYFSFIGGIVTETGGVFSGAAALARAFGLPYIAGARGAVAAIKDGDTVTIDNGQLTIDN